MRLISCAAFAFTVGATLSLAGQASSTANQAPSPFYGGTWKFPTSAFGPCEYHPIPSDARALVATFSPTGDIRSDGKGAYWEGADTARSYFGSRGVAYNFYAYWPETCDEPLPHQMRVLEVRLTAPHGGGKPFGIVRGGFSAIHVFPNGPAIQDVPVGETIEAKRVLVRFEKGGEIYYVRMGTEANDPGLPGYVELLPGDGTTTARIKRETASRWSIVAPPGSLGRLAKWGPKPVDLGLYDFSYELHLTIQRPER